jgi:hypothetical protein
MSEIYDEYHRLMTAYLVLMDALQSIRLGEDNPCYIAQEAIKRAKELNNETQ